MTNIVKPKNKIIYAESLKSLVIDPYPANANVIIENKIRKIINKVDLPPLTKLSPYSELRKFISFIIEEMIQYYDLFNGQILFKCRV